MKELEDMEQLAGEYYEEGRQTFYENKLEEAALLIQNAIHMYKKCGNMEMYTRALNLIGVIYGATGNETMAVDYYLDGMECAIDNHFDNILSLFYNNIGSRYQELHEYEKAIDYFLKAAKVLETAASKKEPSHDAWSLITYLNLAISYCELKLYELANKYLDMAEDYLNRQEESLYKYTVLIFKCRLYWCMGRKEYVYDNLNELLESSVKDNNLPDYVQDMRELCRLFKSMGEYECWKNTILAAEDYFKQQNSVFFELAQTEMWMDYYQTIGDQKKYVELCVEHAQLYQKQKIIADKERAAAIDIKIELCEKEAERKRAEAMSETDALTGLGNRYSMEQEAKRIVEQAMGQKITVGVLDVDCFKQHNDTYGHIQGDRCLKVVANVLQDAVRDIGHVYRFGGDEFVIMLPAGTDEEVEQIAKTVERNIQKANIDNVNSTVLPKITISQGYACFVPDAEEKGDSLIEHADKALYYVKNHGRNAYHIIRE